MTTMAAPSSEEYVQWDPTTPSPLQQQQQQQVTSSKRPAAAQIAGRTGPASQEEAEQRQTLNDVRDLLQRAVFVGGRFDGIEEAPPEPIPESIQLREDEGGAPSSARGGFRALASSSADSNVQLASNMMTALLLSRQFEGISRKDVVIQEGEERLALMNAVHAVIIMQQQRDAQTVLRRAREDVMSSQQREHKLRAEISSRLIELESACRRRTEAAADETVATVAREASRAFQLSSVGQSSSDRHWLEQEEGRERHALLADCDRGLANVYSLELSAAQGIRQRELFGLAGGGSPYRAGAGGGHGDVLLVEAAPDHLYAVHGSSGSVGQRRATPPTTPTRRGATPTGARTTQQPLSAKPRTTTGTSASTTPRTTAAATAPSADRTARTPDGHAAASATSRRGGAPSSGSRGGAAGHGAAGHGAAGHGAAGSPRSAAAYRGPSPPAYVRDADIDLTPVGPAPRGLERSETSHDHHHDDRRTANPAHARTKKGAGVVPSSSSTVGTPRLHRSLIPPPNPPTTFLPYWGWMYKSTGALQTWQRRFFVLTTKGTLKSALSDTAGPWHVVCSAESILRVEVDAYHDSAGGSIAPPTSQYHQYGFYVEVFDPHASRHPQHYARPANNKRYRFCCYNRRELHAWLAVLRRATDVVFAEEEAGTRARSPGRKHCAIDLDDTAARLTVMTLRGAVPNGGSSPLGGGAEGGGGGGGGGAVLHHHSPPTYRRRTQLEDDLAALEYRKQQEAKAAAMAAHQYPQPAVNPISEQFGPPPEVL